MSGRREHYGEFYGGAPDASASGGTGVSTDASASGGAGVGTGESGDDDGRPIGVVIGNCQAESLRVMLEGPDLRLVRVPPVFELEQSDMPHLARLLARTSVLISQPVRHDYHGLPVGTRQLASRLPAGARMVRIPVVRFAGLYPFHAIVRPPGDLGMVPPIVEYHDLRTLVLAHRMRQRAATGAAKAPLTAAAEPENRASATREQVLAVAAESIAQLHKREVHHDTVVLSDLFARPTFELMRTINHPGNAVWQVAAQRVRERLGLDPWQVDVGRELLNAVHAPREPTVIRAFGLENEPAGEWMIGGAPVTTDTVRRAHLEWYAENPSVIDAGLARHAATIAALGLHD